MISACPEKREQISRWARRGSKMRSDRSSVQLHRPSSVHAPRRRTRQEKNSCLEPFSLNSASVPAGFYRTFPLVSLSSLFFETWLGSGNKKEKYNEIDVAHPHAKPVTLEVSLGKKRLRPILNRTTQRLPNSTGDPFLGMMW